MNQTKSLLNHSKDPLLLFANWFQEASKNEINDPNAMNLSTISLELKPTSRMVLLKSFSKRGFVFYTNINSKKGKSILNNPNVALNFHWKSIAKQVRIEGIAKQVADKEADKYFNSRHEESRIGAWASSQSSELKSRKELEQKFSYYKAKFKKNLIPRPMYWTGFRVESNLIEFWQDIKFRLHDRLEYRKIDKQWISKKLYP